MSDNEAEGRGEQSDLVSPPEDELPEGPIRVDNVGDKIWFHMDPVEKPDHPLERQALIEVGNPQGVHR